MTITAKKLNDDEFKELTDTLFLLNGLYAQMSEERDYLATNVSKMSAATKQFQGYLERLGDHTEGFKALIQETLHQESDHTARLVAEKAYQVFGDQAKTTLAQLNESLDRAGHKLKDYERKSRFLSKGLILFMLTSAIVGGLMGGALVHSLFPSMDEHMRSQLEIGKIMLETWPKLDKKDREQIQALLQQKPSAESD